MRAVLSAAMAVLVVLALLAGNCLSCPLMLLAAHGSPHACCHHGKAPVQQCRTLALRHFVKADSGMHPAPVVAVHIDAPAPADVARPAMEIVSPLTPLAYPPPGAAPLRI